MYKAIQTRYYWPQMAYDIEEICSKCDACVKYNPKPKKNLVVIPEIIMENIRLMDLLGMDIGKFGGRSYLIIVDSMCGYMLCENMGKHTTSKEISNVVRKLFFKLGISYSVHSDGDPEFRGPFQELLEEFKIPHTPSSPYNLEANRYARCY